MLDNLVFCLNATVPIFLLMVLGYFFKRIELFTESMTKGLNKFVFKVALPVLVFKELAGSDFHSVWDGRFLLFCFLATLASIVISYIIARLCFKDKSVFAEFIQGSYRSSAALLGVGIVENLYGSAGMVPLMIIGAVPLYNVAAVIILTVSAEEHGKIDGSLIKRTVKGVLSNPIIVGIAIGLVWSLAKLPILFPKTIGYVSNLATPLGLMALGASFELRAAIKKVGPTVIATALKLIGFCAIWIPVAIAMGYTHDKLIAVLIMTGSPTTVSCFVMAKSMGHEGTVSAGIVMLTTLLSAFTLTLWLYILRINGLI